MKSVLIVDDEEAVRTTVRYLSGFEKRGITNVFEASCVKEAIDILRANPIDLIITDIYMVGQNGLYLMEYAKNKYPNI
ncbi:MAG: response regulator, partial [Sphaerochaetaceae bacterium]|nr:response regulator [Sphaerochaetaceae bacterium]